jgi:peptidoglycan L-alanyl-D-glutamate endopeptidase CwlK
MPRYSETSKARLKTCHKDLQLIFNTVISHFDNSILCGHRGKAAQMEAYNSGKSKVKWPNGKHNKTPSMAVDAAPYPIDWKDRERMILFAGYVMGVAQVLHDEGMITHRLRWGGDWDRDTEVADNGFDDLVHFELVE